MAMKVVGVGRSKGNYEGFDYDNYIVHGLEDDKNVVGQRATYVKVKADVFHRDLSSITDADMSKLLGLMVDFGYDKYGKVQSVSVRSGK